MLVFKKVRSLHFNIRISLIPFIICFLIQDVFSFDFMSQQDWEIRLGPSATATYFRSINNSQHIYPGVGFYSLAGYRPNSKYGLISNFKFAISSYAHIANTKNINVEYEGSNIKGDAFLRSVSIGPIVQIYYPRYFSGSQLYFVLGAHWAIQSIKFRRAEVRGQPYSIFQKLTFETFGLILGIGLEEIISLSKSRYPFSFELIFQYLQGRKASKVGGEHNRAIILSTEDEGREVMERSILFNWGIHLF